MVNFSCMGGSSVWVSPHTTECVINKRMPFLGVCILFFSTKFMHDDCAVCIESHDEHFLAFQNMYQISICRLFYLLFFNCEVTASDLHHTHDNGVTIPTFFLLPFLPIYLLNSCVVTMECGNGYGHLENIIVFE